MLIHKYVIEKLSNSFGFSRVLMPADADVLKVVVVDEKVTLWASFDDDDDQIMKERKVYFCPTGRKIPEEVEDFEYIDTIFQGPFVWHVFVEESE